LDLKTKAQEITLKLNAKDQVELQAAGKRIAEYTKKKYGVENAKDLTEQKIVEICASRLKKTAKQLLNDPNYATVIRKEREKIGKDLIKRTAKELGLTEAEVQILTQVR